MNHMFENFKDLPSKIAEMIHTLVSSPLNLLVLVLFLVGLVVLLRFSKIKFTPRLMTMVAISVAIASVLNLIVLFRMPQGGSVTLASMVPIFLLALAYGGEVGMLAGFLFGVINIILGGYIVHPAQLFLDYPLAFMFVGVIGFFPQQKNLGAIVSVLLRFLAHFASGMIFFGEYAKDQPVWLYSLTYNGTFLLAELAIALVILNLLPTQQLISSIRQRRG